MFLYLPRYVAQYNDIPSPLSNAEKLAESSRREEELRRERERERDEASKAYHERESRVPMTAQQRKGMYEMLWYKIYIKVCRIKQYKI